MNLPETSRGLGRLDYTVKSASNSTGSNHVLDIGITSYSSQDSLALFNIYQLEQYAGYNNGISVTLQHCYKGNGPALTIRSSECATMVQIKVNVVQFEA